MIFNKEIDTNVSFDNTEVLNEVKEIIPLPGFDGLITDLAASYFEVTPRQITEAYNMHKDDFIKDGVYFVRKKNLSTAIINSGLIIEKNDEYFYILLAGNPVIIRDKGQLVFTKRALLRLALILRVSFTAERIRRKIVEPCESMRERASEVIYNKKLRDKYIENTYVLNPVKKTPFYDAFPYITVNLAARYFEVTELAVISIFQSFYLEFDENGSQILDIAEINELLRTLEGCKAAIPTGNGIYKAIINNKVMEFKKDDNILLTQNDLLLMAMLLPDSKVARDIRYTLYTNDVGETTDVDNISSTQADTDGNKEKDIFRLIGEAYLNGDSNKLIHLCEQAINEREKLATDIRVSIDSIEKQIKELELLNANSSKKI